MGKVTIFLAAFILAGCQTAGSVKIPEKVYVPVLSCPSPANVTRPNLLVPTLKDKDDPGTVAQYYKADYLQLKGYAENLELTLDEYRKAAATYNSAQAQILKLHELSDVKPAGTDK